MTNLPFIQQEMIRYGMTTYLTLGLVGNICNCIMFTHSSHRRTASTIYFLSLSILAIIYLTWSVAPLIYTLNHTDPQTQSVFYCKIRLYISHSLGQCLRYFVVCASADRFFVTRTSIRMRSLNSIPVAKRLVFIVATVFFLSAIHLPILLNIRNDVCGTAGLYKLIYAIYQITLVGIIPPVLMITFSFLTIRSLHQQHIIQLRTRNRDRCLLRMVIAEVIVSISTSIPYSINLVYGAATYYMVNKSARRLEIETFISFVTQFIIYLTGVTPFYLFLLTSKSFRKGFINVVKKFWKKYIVRQTRVVPSNMQNNTITTKRGTMYNRPQRTRFEGRPN